MFRRKAWPLPSQCALGALPRRSRARQRHLHAAASEPALKPLRLPELSSPRGMSRPFGRPGHRADGQASARVIEQLHGHLRSLRTSHPARHCRSDLRANVPACYPCFAAKKTCLSPAEPHFGVCFILDNLKKFPSPGEISTQVPVMGDRQAEPIPAYYPGLAGVDAQVAAIMESSSSLPRDRVGRLEVLLQAERWRWMLG